MIASVFYRSMGLRTGGQGLLSASNDIVLKILHVVHTTYTMTVVDVLKIGYKNQLPRTFLTYYLNNSERNKYRLCK